MRPEQSDNHERSVTRRSCDYAQLLGAFGGKFLDANGKPSSSFSSSAPPA